MTPSKDTSKLRYLWAALMLTFTSFILLKTVVANTDLSVGRFALHMDERITFDGITRLLHPDGIKDFFNQLRDGGDHRYGRSVWNISALLTLIPEKIWGESGQIIGTRMGQVLLLISAYLVFAFGLLRNWFYRFVLLCTLLVVPYATYYMTMPKPEPLQLLFLAIFSVLFFKNKSRFGWHWIFLGLSLGTKIATLPAVIDFAAIALLSDMEGRQKIQQAGIAFLSCLLGLALTVPILLPAASILIATLWGIPKIRSRFKLPRGWLYLAYTASIGLAIGVGRKPTMRWLQCTFFNRTHGDDQSSINAWSWVKYFFNPWLQSPLAISIGLASVILILLTIYLYKNIRTLRDLAQPKAAGLVMFGAGAALNLSIFIDCQRLWGFYLFPGTVLCLVGLAMLIEQQLSVKTTSWTGRIARYLAYAAGAGLLSATFLFWTPATLSELRELSTRTQQEDFIENKQAYEQATSFLEAHSIKLGRQLEVIYDPSLFPPRDTEHYRIVEFWGPYPWDRSPDVIILKQNHTPRGTAPPKDSPNYPAYTVEQKGYQRHVISKKAPSYKKAAKLPGDGEILILHKEYP